MTDNIRSFLNYAGGKYRLLNQITPLFPIEYNQFIDLFCGSGVVAINYARQNNLFNSNTYLLNDSNTYLIKLMEYISKSNINIFISEVEKIIKDYNLSDTKSKGYEYYKVDSSKGLALINKAQFMTLRSDFNNGIDDELRCFAMFYTLIVFGFNNQIRFNQKNQYNLPVGKRDFNNQMRNKLLTFHHSLQIGKYKFTNKDFKQVSFKKNDFIYADPPYSITTATYTENNNWNTDNDKDLFDYLDNVDSLGAKFALSNVMEHKNVENIILKEWASSYKIHYLDFNYNNSNYQSKAKQSKTVEVLITNY